MALYVTLGISGCGKSTWTTENGKGKLIVNPDAIRKELTGNISDQSRNYEVFQLAYERTRSFLHQGASVVFDSTALNGKTRKELLKIAHEEGVDARLVVFQDSAFPILCRKRVQSALQNGQDRSDTTRQDIIDRQHESYKAALQAIEQEPWDDIEFV